MDKKELLNQIDVNNSIRCFPYDYLSKGILDIGFKSEVINGKDYHQVTRDITVSFQKFQNNSLINMFYTSGQPMYVELEDREVIPYYSDFIEWRYILSGYLVMEFEGERAVFQENEICFINSSAQHRESIADSKCISINISIDRSFFNEQFINNITLTPLQKFLRTNILHLGHMEKYLKFTSESSNRTDVLEYIFTIINEVRFQKPGYLDISRGYFVRLMDTLSSGYHFKFSKTDSTKYQDSLFDSVSEFMQQNLGTVSIDNLIETFHFQTNYFNNLIKKYTGLTYSNYLIQLRMERAKVLLETTDLSIEEIIWLVGYHNKSFFYKRFTELTGISPAHYRKGLGKCSSFN